MASQVKCSSDCQIQTQSKVCVVQHAGSKRSGRKIWKCDLLGMQIYSTRPQKNAHIVGGSAEWTAWNCQQQMTHGSIAFPHIRCCLWHTGNKATPRWEICKYRCVCKSDVAMFDIHHNLHFTSVTVSHRHQRHSAEDDGHFQLVSMEERCCLLFDRTDTLLLFNYRIKASITCPL